MVYNNVFVASLLLQLYFFPVEYYWMHAFLIDFVRVESHCQFDVP